MLNEFDFGILQSHINDKQITDINYNGKQVWIDHLKKGRYPLEPFVAHESIQALVYKIANFVNLPFNATSPVLEAETNELRISILHPSIARGGLSLSIRKTPSICRLHDEETGIKHYAPVWVIEFLQDAIINRKNIMVSGLPGSGKTELVKYLMESIPAYQRVITIEDSLELRYGDIHPKKDHVMLKVQDHFSYEKAIKTSLRQRPDWICVSEIRGTEIIYLLQSISTGTSLISTVHAESAYAIPYRMMIMMPGIDLSNQSISTLVHDSLDIGVHLEIVTTNSGVHRLIREVVYFDVNERYEGVKHSVYLKNGKNKIIKYKRFLEEHSTKSEEDKV
jgi:pilus assembly protein CpaF